MGTGPQGVLYHATARIGYYAPRDPQPGSEAGRYLATRLGQPWLAGPSTQIWWCMCFVSMCFDLAGETAAINGLHYNTDTCIRRNPGKYVSTRDAQPGDVVIFNWDGNATTDHVGIVERNLGGGVLQTIEGNTSPGTAGSQSAGNGVWRRQRSRSIARIIRPTWTSTTPTTSSSATNDWTLPIDGSFGPKSIMVAQSRAGTTIDGIISGQTTANKRYHAALANVIYDGGGSDLIRAIQHRLGTTPDGSLGPTTARAWQTHLNTTTTLLP